MIDYKVMVNIWVSDLSFQRELILTIEEGYIEDQELLEDVLFEKAKEYLENEYIELVEFEELKQTEQANLYRITENDVY
jgi:hypothetical protein